MARTASGVAYDRSGPRGRAPVLLVHAGVADRRMWDGVWGALTEERDTTRLDLRGFGESDARPERLSHVDDVVDTVTYLGLGPVHLVGASFGAGVTAGVAVSRPDLVASLLLVAPGGALVPSMTPALRAFIDAEDAALSRGDLDGAVEVTVTTWVDGPHRGTDDVDPAVRELVGRMQRRAFEVTAGWDDLDEAELDPPVLDRLDELPTRTLVLSGALDLDAIGQAAGLVAAVDGVTHVEWADVAHLPSMERPGDFLTLLGGWLRER